MLNLSTDCLGAFSAKSMPWKVADSILRESVNQTMHKSRHQRTDVIKTVAMEVQYNYTDSGNGSTVAIKLIQ